MPKPFTEWTVLPHGKLTQLEDDILTVQGEIPVPLGEFPRRMTVVRLHDGRLIIFSAIALDEDEMTALEGYGRPTYLIVPNARHRMDARAWKDRYPEMVVVAPEDARREVSTIVNVDCTEVDFRDPNVRLVTTAGTSPREAALVVHTRSGTTLVVNDLIWNAADRPGFSGFVLHALGMTGDEPRIPVLVKMGFVEDKLALRAQLETWAGIGDLRRVIVSHGNVIAKEPRGVLGQLAQSLG
jgi:hypothetical protein